MTSTTLAVPCAEIGITWKWYVKHELIILALLLIFFGLAWAILDDRPQVEPDMPAYFL
jgi:hypothetical protein